MNLFIHFYNLHFLPFTLLTFSLIPLPEGRLTVYYPLTPQFDK